MSATNRSARIEKLVARVKKLFSPTPAPPKERTAFHTLLFGCILENSPHDAAEKAFAALIEKYPDPNELRVTNRAEMAEELKVLTDPRGAADRIRLTLKSVFDSVYAFDLEFMKKQNLGQAVATIEKYKGATPFMVAYFAQNALGGHSIPVNDGLLVALEVLEIITPAEAAKKVVPGLERAVPKNKGVEIGGLLHQLGVEVGKNPYGPGAKKVLLDVDPACKDRLPKRPVKVETPPAPPTPPVEPAKSAKVAADKAPAAPKSTDPKAPPKKADSKKADDKKPEDKKVDDKKPELKPPAKPAPPVKKPAPPVVKKPAPAPPAAKKPPAPKKPAVKKVAKKPSPPAKKKTSGKLAKRKPR